MENLNKEIILKTLHEHRDLIRKFGVKKLILFGSYARDEQKETSDIDFLVEFGEGKYNIDNHLGLLYLLENLFNKKIDLVKPHLVRSELKDDILGGIQHVAEI
ncbi:MAG: nucleotidyltransferase family protein [Candidatus Woesearchaeota archaeon]